jgi:hypothetical protein
MVLYVYDMVCMMLKEYDMKGKHEHDDLMHEHGMEWNDYVQLNDYVMHQELNGLMLKELLKGKHDVFDA